MTFKSTFIYPKVLNCDAAECYWTITVSFFLSRQLWPINCPNLFSEETNKEQKQHQKTLTCPRVATFQVFVLTRKYFFQKFIKNGVVRLQLSSSIDMVVDSIGRILFIIAVKVTLSSFSEILPVGGHGVRVLPSVAGSSKIVVSLAQLGIEAWYCTVWSDAQIVQSVYKLV